MQDIFKFSYSECDVGSNVIITRASWRMKIATLYTVRVFPDYIIERVFSGLL